MNDADTNRYDRQEDAQAVAARAEADHQHRVMQGARAFAETNHPVGAGSVSAAVNSALVGQPLATQLDLEHIFQYHAPGGEQLAQYGRLREAAKRFAISIVQNSPAGADQSAAIRHVREAVMTANAAIALSGRINR